MLITAITKKVILGLPTFFKISGAFNLREFNTRAFLSVILNIKVS